MSFHAALSLIYLDIVSRILAILATPAGLIIALLIALVVVLALSNLVHYMWLGAYGTPETERHPGS